MPPGGWEPGDLGQRQTLKVRVKKSSVLSQGTGKLSHLRRRLESEDMILDGRESGKEALMMRHSSSFRPLRVISAQVY
jgi:hypothetical protein